MAKVDWHGLATAIGQVNQLIQPSYAAKKQIETKEFQERTLWEYGLDELTRGQANLESLEQEYEDEYNKAFVIDASLVKDKDSKHDSGNAINLHEIVSSNKLDNIYSGIDQINQRAAELTGAIEEISIKNRSAQLGGNYTVPITPDPNAKNPWERGKPITTNGEITGYESWDTDGSTNITGDEASEAITSVVNMMIESGVQVDEDAFRAGYRLKFDDEKRTQMAIDRKMAAERDEIKWEAWLANENHKANVTRPAAILKLEKERRKENFDPYTWDADKLKASIVNLERESKLIC